MYKYVLFSSEYISGCLSYIPSGKILLLECHEAVLLNCALAAITTLYQLHLLLSKLIHFLC